MKKVISLILIITIVFLSSCSKTNQLDENMIILPDITGLNKSEIEIAFDSLNVEIFFIEIGEANELNSLVFITFLCVFN
jgi:hypothetical protein